MNPELEFQKAMTRSYMIPGMIWPREMIALSQLFRSSMRHVEIGVFCGKSLYVTAAAMTLFGPNAESKTIVAVDDLSEKNAHGTELVPSISWWKAVLNATVVSIREQFRLRLQVLTESSSNAAIQLLRADKFDSVYIDANHEIEFVGQDIASWWQHLKHGGIMAGHDYSADRPGVIEVVNRAFDCHFQVFPGTRIWYVHKNETTDRLVSEFTLSI